MPPVTKAGIVGWARSNLFYSWLSSLFTLAALWFLFTTVPPVLQWLFFDASWIGTTRDACTTDGACWVFISVRFEQFLFGFYPETEFWRGVPLITVLFMSSVMLPIFMPEGMSFDKLLRAMIGIIFFQSAYMAEVIRGGLQAIPRGQYEAAEALGLSYWKTMFLIILPQAMKLVIPGIVNTFIALFKDTTLVLIIGLFDLLAVVQSAFSDPKWLGFSVEGYVFVAAVYWISCFSMSRYSMYLERKLHTGH